MNDTRLVNQFLGSQHCQMLSVQVDAGGTVAVHFDAEDSGCGYVLFDKDGVHVILPD